MFQNYIEYHFIDHSYDFSSFVIKSVISSTSLKPDSKIKAYLAYIFGLSVPQKFYYKR